MNKPLLPAKVTSSHVKASSEDVRRALKAGISYRTLESRVAFDGAATATALAVSDQQSTSSGDTQTAAEPAASSDAVSREASPVDALSGLADALQASVASPSDRVPAIVFIDSAVENIDQIVSNIATGTEIVLLDSRSSGVEQIAGYLSGRTNVGSIHIVSHGETGMLYLGTDTLSSANMADYNTALTQIGRSLADDADILLYGCNVANGTGGMDFVRALSLATSADVAASIDNTGGDESDGDWVLEATNGAIEAASLSNPLYAGLLAKTNTGAWVANGVTTANDWQNTTDGITTTVTFTNGGLGTFTALNGNATLATATAGNGLTAATFDNNALGAASVGFTWSSTNTTDVGTVTINFSSAVTNPVIHVDRLGGFAGGVAQSNSSVWTLATPGASLTRMSGVNHFLVDTVAGTFQRRVGDTSINNGEADSNSAEGTAAGSVRVNGTFTSITFTLKNAIPSGGATIGDGIELAFAIDAPPVAVADSFGSIVHDTSVTINVRANDSDVRGDAINVTKVNGTSIVSGGPGVAVTGGIVTLNATGNLVFTPTANYAGSPSFTYTIADANGGEATATVTGTVTNVAPALDLDASGAGTGWTKTYVENGSAVSIADIDPSIVDTDDANMDSGSVTLTNQQTGDRLLVNGSSATTGTIGTITWTRTDTTVTFSGVATKAQYAAAIAQVQFENTTDTPSTTPRIINAVVNDGTVASNIAVATINIDTAPDPVNDSYSGDEDVAIVGNVLTNDTDVGTTPSIANPLSIVTGPANGTLTSFNTATGAFVYTPNGDYNGSDSFVYRYTDANGDSKTATVSLTIDPVNDAPTQVVPAVIGPVAEDAVLAITGITVTDVDSTPLTTTLTVSNGKLNLDSLTGVTVTGDGTGSMTIAGTAAAINAVLAGLSFTPTADFNGTASFTITTDDGVVSGTTATRSITISPVVYITDDRVTTN